MQLGDRKITFRRERTVCCFFIFLTKFLSLLKQLNDKLAFLHETFLHSLLRTHAAKPRNTSTYQTFDAWSQLAQGERSKRLLARRNSRHKFLLLVDLRQKLKFTWCTLNLWLSPCNKSTKFSHNYLSHCLVGSWLLNVSPWTDCLTLPKVAGNEAFMCAGCRHLSRRGVVVLAGFTITLHFTISCVMILVKTNTINSHIRQRLFNNSTAKEWLGYK